MTPTPPVDLRDYFAIETVKAQLTGTVQGGLVVMEAVVNAATRRGLSVEDYFAKRAYEQADALLKARTA